MRIERNLPPRRVTTSIALRQLDDFSIGDCHIPAREALSGFGHAETISVIDDIRIAPSGDIWVRRSALAGEDEKIDVFDKRGEYRGTILNMPFPAAFVTENLMVAISKDALEVPSITAYRIQRQR
jgi:hypothetical protein